MVKILNKFIFYLKNILLPILLIATIFIVSQMFQRLGKDIFGDNLLEFIEVIAPFVLLIILNLINMFLFQKEVKDNLYYNMTSLLVMITIAIFCIRACFDQKMYFIHQYGYDINFNYFADQIAAIKVMLYGLSFANLMLMIANYIKVEDVSEVRETMKNDKKYEKNTDEEVYNKTKSFNNKKVNKK